MNMENNVKVEGSWKFRIFDRTGNLNVSGLGTTIYQITLQQ